MATPSEMRQAALQEALPVEEALPEEVPASPLEGIIAQVEDALSLAPENVRGLLQEALVKLQEAAAAPVEEAPVPEEGELQV